MELHITQARESDAATVENLLQLYVYDYTDFMDWDVEADGRYNLPDLDGQLFAPGRSVFLLHAEGALAGFAIIDQPPDPPADHDTDMREFFVMRRFRRKGVGAWFARELFGRFPGRWRVEQLPKNVAAIAFWRKVIGQYTGGAFREMVNPHGINVQYFDNRRG
ncbi:MAG: GNAT family N-acetyltransferase [Anaerolineae bacterium]|nr:GNAT family N-acetyltransferase [Anaerolineae bacterium]